MGELIYVKFIEAVDDFSKNSIQEMVYDMGMNYILDEKAIKISKEEYDKITGEKQGKQIIKKTVNNQINSNADVEVLIHLLKKNREQGSEAIVEEFMFVNRVYTIRDDLNPEMYIYRNGIYIPNGKTYLEEFVRKRLGEAYTTHLFNLIYEKVKIDTYIERKDFIDNQPKDKICLQTGIYNLKTKKLEPFTEDLFFFNKLPIIYNPCQDCPNIKNFFNSVLTNQSDILVLQELFGFLLLKDYKWEKSFLFSGKGRNGKGKTISLMKRFIGDDNSAKIPLQDFEKDPYSAGELVNKLVNLGGDINSTTLNETGLFKQLTGKDPVSAQVKFKNRFSFVNYAKMVFCCNKPPRSRDSSEGFWDRWVYIKFENKFIPQNELDKYSKEEIKERRLKLQDTSIIDKITTEEEISGLFNWAIKGLERLFSKNQFSYSLSTKEVEEQWVLDSNSCLRFVKEKCIEDADGYISIKDFKIQYSLFCKSKRLKQEKPQIISETLLMEFGVVQDKKYIKDENAEYENQTKQIRVWDGISFNS